MNPASQSESASSSLADQTVQGTVEKASVAEIAEPPPYVDIDVTVCATTADQNPRYDQEFMISTSFIHVPGLNFGSAHSPESASYVIPEGWVAHTQPEGSVYYVNTGSKVVTDSPIFEVGIYQKICAAIQVVLFNLKDMESLPTDYEIYLRASSDSVKCCYYMVDHNSCMEFWLQDHPSSELKLTAAVSVSHLKYTLQEHYWIHREYFPHRPVSDGLREELINVLRHGRADHLTSPVSTFMFNGGQCMEFIQLIDVGASKCNNPYMTCIIARLWKTISRFRFDHYYGHDFARISREQRRLPHRTYAKNIVLQVVSSLLFKLPDAKVKELEGLFTDRLLYSIHWMPFAAEQISAWEKTSSRAVALLIANAGLLASCKTYPTMYCGLASTSACIASLFIGQLLTYRHHGLDKMSATAACNFLFDIHHQTLGFAPTAIQFIAPQALVTWAIILVASETGGLILERISSTFGIIISLVSLASLFTLILLARYLYALRVLWGGITPFHRSTTDAEPSNV